jgi:hypothetical protein
VLFRKKKEEIFPVIQSFTLDFHEWQTTEKEPLTDVVTWVFEEGTFVPTARITDAGSQSIVTDYLIRFILPSFLNKRIVFLRFFNAIRCFAIR